ncbi:PapD-like protein, partial [Zopfochytrium polystomum]
LRLTNVHPSPARAVTFKIKTTAPTGAFARPNRGVVLPGESVTVVCSWAPSPQQRTTEGRDRFLVECVAVPKGMAGDGVGDVWAHVE